MEPMMDASNSSEISNSNQPGQPAENNLPTDQELHRSGQDVIILKNLVYDIVKPRLRNISGFNPIGSARTGYEDLGLWMMAMNVMPWKFRSIYVARLTQPALEVRGRQGPLELLVFLTRDVEFITAIRQEIHPKPGTSDPVSYAVTNFEHHRSVHNLLEWWIKFRGVHEIPLYNDEMETFTMQVFRMVRQFLDAIAFKRMEAFHEAQHAQNAAKLLLLQART
jgi:hypothetical protein